MISIDIIGFDKQAVSIRGGGSGAAAVVVVAIVPSKGHK